MSTAARSAPSPTEDLSAQPAPFSDLLTPRGAPPTPFPVDWIPYSTHATPPATSEVTYTTSALPPSLLAHLEPASDPSILPYLSEHRSTATLTSLNSSTAPSIDPFPASYPFLAQPWERPLPSAFEDRQAGVPSTNHSSLKGSANGTQTLRRLSSAILRPRKGGQQFGADQRQAPSEQSIGTKSGGSSVMRASDASGYVELPDEVEVRGRGEWHRQVQQWESAERAKGFETTEQMVQVVQVDQKTAEALRVMGL